MWHGRSRRRKGFSPKDLDLQPDDLLGRVKSQLLGEALPEDVEDGEGPGWGAGGGKSPGQQEVAGFPQRLLLDGPFRQADRPARMPCGQSRGSGALERIEVGTRELPPSPLGPLCVRVLRQGFPSPRVKSGLELSERGFRSLLAECGAPCLDVGEKRFDVHEAPAVAGEAVATRAGEDEGRISQGSTCPADEHVQVGGRVGRGAFGPQRFGQGVLRDVVAPPNEEQTEQLPGQAAPKGGNR